MLRVFVVGREWDEFFRSREDMAEEEEDFICSSCRFCRILWKARSYCCILDTEKAKEGDLARINGGVAVRSCAVGDRLALSDD